MDPKNKRDLMLVAGISFLVLVTFLMGLLIGMDIKEKEIRDLRAQNEDLKHRVWILEDNLAEYVKENIQLRALLNNSTHVLAYVKGVETENDRLWDLNYRLVNALENAIGPNETWTVVDRILDEVYGKGSKG